MSRKGWRGAGRGGSEHRFADPTHRGVAGAMPLCPREKPVQLCADGGTSRQARDRVPRFGWCSPWRSFPLSREFPGALEPRPEAGGAARPCDLDGRALPRQEGRRGVGITFYPLRSARYLQPAEGAGVDEVTADAWPWDRASRHQVHATSTMAKLKGCIGTE